MTVAAGTVTSWARQCEAVTDAATRWSFLTACRRVTVTVTGSDWHGRARASLSRGHGRGASARSALKLPELQACLKCTSTALASAPAAGRHANHGPAVPVRSATVTITVTFGQ